MPDRSTFGADTTTDEVLVGIDLHGKQALVTGGSGGLGLETARALASKGARVVITARDMTFAPEHLYNLYVTYDLERTGTQLALFYTVTGDTLVAGAGESKENFVPDVYAEEYGTLNLSLSQRLGDHLVLKLQAKNLTDPEIEEVYRSDHVPGGDVTRTSYTRGRELSIGLTFTP